MITVGETRENYRSARALLSPEESGRARPLRSWSAAERARLSQVLSALLMEWRQAWGLEEPARAAVVCDSASEGFANSPVVGAWCPVGEGASGLWWAVCQSAAVPALPMAIESGLALASLGHALMGTPWSGCASSLGAGPGAIAADVIQQAWADLAARLRRALPVKGGMRHGPKPGTEVLHPWSGALCVRIPWWDQTLLLLVAAESVPLLGGGPTRSPRPGTLTPVLRAVSQHDAVLRVELKSFELTIGALASLRIGDVLRTSHGLDTPVSISLLRADQRTGSTVCTGFLGQRGGTRAVELAATDSYVPDRTATSRRDQRQQPT